MDDVDRRRASLTGRLTLRLALDRLLDDGQCIHFDEGTYRTVTGADRFDEAVVFQDSMDRLMDAWVGAGAGVVAWLADLAGYPDAELKQIVNQLGPGSVTTIPELRWAAVVAAQ